MTSGVLITLIICSTFIILFGIAYLGGRQSKKEKEILKYLESDFPTANLWERKDGKN